MAVSQQQKVDFLLKKLGFTKTKTGLAVDSTLMSESVKEAVVDGKTQIDQLSTQLNKLKKENNVLKEAYTQQKAELLLESKTAG